MHGHAIFRRAKQPASAVLEQRPPIPTAVASSAPMVRLLVTRSRAVLRPVSRAPVGCAGFRTSASSWAAASERSTGSGTQETPSTPPERDSWNAIVELATIQEPALPGSLHAWPITAKMNMCTETMQTTCGSRMLQGWVAGYDASAVALLKGAGAQLVGKTNCDEFGMGSENLHSVHGPVVSPWVGKDGAPRVAGGSSGGAAAAVAAGLCRVALGSDTGGSVRLPAAYCGVWGLKPSYGLISRFGLVSYVDSTDTIGIIARQVEDVASVLGVYEVSPSGSTQTDKSQTCWIGRMKTIRQVLLSRFGQQCGTPRRSEWNSLGSHPSMVQGRSLRPHRLRWTQSKKGE